MMTPQFWAQPENWLQLQQEELWNHSSALALCKHFVDVNMELT